MRIYDVREVDELVVRSNEASKHLFQRNVDRISLKEVNIFL